MIRKNKKRVHVLKLQKAPTGIKGFDSILEGGLPKNRPTIVCGNAGCGKTVMCMEFLVKGALEFNEPGVFMSFEENREDLSANMESLHPELSILQEKKKIYIEYLDINKNENYEAGLYNLEGLFVRLEQAIDRIGAKRVALDSLDALFSGLDGNTLRLEIKRLFKWLKEKKITALITAEIGNSFVTKHGLEEYVADCVILLDNRIINQLTTRRLRIVKYRGSEHGNNEYPFTITKEGISLEPLTTEWSNLNLPTNRITSGIIDLDAMLGGGFFDGTSILVSGSAGTGKTSIAASLINATCKKKKHSLYCAFEETPQQITRNMRSIGINIHQYIKPGILKFYFSRPTLQNLELHLIAIEKIITEFKPEIVVLDPVTNLMSEGVNSEIRQMLVRFVDFLKAKQITILFTAAITLETIKDNPSDEGISAMVDTWILVTDKENNYERNRGIYVLKSRGMNHSTQVREFVITDEGIQLLPVYLTPEAVLTGSAKLQHSLKEKEESSLRNNEIKINEKEIDRKRKAMETAVVLLRTNFATEVERLKQAKVTNQLQEETNGVDREEILDLRNKVPSSVEKIKKKNE